MKKQSGFTVIEIIIVAAFLIAASIVLFIQVNSITNQANNDKKRTAINSIYYGLEESFYKQNNYYPEKITKDTLKVVNPDSLIDPNGNEIGKPESDYRYEPENCKDGKCKQYTLRASLVEEDDFVKQSRNK